MAGSVSKTVVDELTSTAAAIGCVSPGTAEGRRERIGEKCESFINSNQRSTLPLHLVSGVNWMVTDGANTSLPLAGREMLCTVVSTSKYTTELDGT